MQQRRSASRVGSARAPEECSLPPIDRCAAARSARSPGCYRTRAVAAVPPKDQPPLTVAADRVEPRQIAAQLLEVIAGRHPQVLVGRRVVDHLELAKKPAFEV